MPSRPGKFEGETALTVLAYHAANEGRADYDFGAECFFDPPLDFDSEDAKRFARIHGYTDEEIHAALAEAKELCGFSFYETEQGFVYGKRYESPGNLCNALDEAEAEYAGSED